MGSAWFRSSIRGMLGMCIAAGALLGASGAASGQVVISQVFGAGGQTSELFDRDFIELFNRGSTPVNITGWSLQYAQQLSTTQTTASWAVFPLTGVIQPGQYFLVAVQGNTINFNGDVLPPPDLSSTNFINGPLDNSSNLVALMSNTTPLAANSCPVGLAATVDFMRTGQGQFACDQGARLPIPSVGSRAFTRVDSGCQDTNDVSADFIPGGAAPRNSTVSAFLPASISPASIPVGVGTVVTLTVSRGAATCNPLGATLSSVTADLSAFGLSASTALTPVGPNYSTSFLIPAAQASGIYDVAITGTDGAASVGSKARVRVAETPAPNDTPCAATDLNAAGITTGAYVATVNVTEATSDNIDAGGCNAEATVRHSVWYSFNVPAAGGALLITETSTEDVVISRHSGPCGSSLISEGCYDSDITYVPLVGGVQTLIQIGREAAGTTPPAVPLNLKIEYIPPPANDTPCGAIDVTNTLFSGTVHSPAATDEIGLTLSCDTISGSSPPLGGVWYRVTSGDQPGIVDITETSINAMSVGVFTGADCNSLAEVQCVGQISSTRALVNIPANGTYWVLISYRNSSQLRAWPLDLTVEFIPTPGNDTPCGAEPLGTLPTSRVVRARALTSDTGMPNSSCLNMASTLPYTVWYSFTSGPTDTGHLLVRENAATDVTFRSFTGNDCNNRLAYRCSGGSPGDDLFLPISPSTTYWIAVGFDSSIAPSGDYVFDFELVPVPSNDTACGATVLGSFPHSERIGSPSATHDPIVTCSIFVTSTQTNSPVGNGVWYRYTPASDTVLRVRQTSANATVSAVFTGLNCNSLSEVACDSTRDRVTLDSMAHQLRGGTPYWVLIGNRNSVSVSGFSNVEFTLETPQGACCATSGCAIQTQAACGSSGGRYRGNYTVCSSEPQFTSTTPVVIPQYSAAGGPTLVTSEIVVPDAITIADIDVQVSMQAGALGDLHVTLTSPTGLEVDLWNRPKDGNWSSLSFPTCPNNGGQGALASMNGVYIFDDQASSDVRPADIGSAVRVYESRPLPPSRYKPVGCLGDSIVSLNQALVGQSTQGTWTLTMRDYRLGGSPQSMNGWGLIINGGTTPPCACIADFDQNGVANIDDIFIFLNAWFAGCNGTQSGAPCFNRTTDTNGDGINIDDIFIFLNRWFQGC